MSLTLLVQRNLAASWYHEAPTIGIKGDLKPMQVIPWQSRGASKVTCILRIVFSLVKELVNSQRFVIITVLKDFQLDCLISRSVRLLTLHDE